MMLSIPIDEIESCAELVRHVSSDDSMLNEVSIIETWLFFNKFKSVGGFETEDLLRMSLNAIQMFAEIVEEDDEINRLKKLEYEIEDILKERNIND